MRVAVPMLLALAACQPADAPAAPETAVSPPAAASAPGTAPAPTPPPSPSGMPDGRITSAERLAGEYRVAGVDGKGIDFPHGISASISGTRIHVVSDCVNLAWDYRFEGAALATTRAAVEGCGRGLYPEEEAIAAAFDSADAVGVNSANGLEFTGGGRSVTLFSQ